jgi:hypothetical protein
MMDYEKMRGLLIAVWEDGYECGVDVASDHAGETRRMKREYSGEYEEGWFKRFLALAEKEGEGE